MLKYFFCALFFYLSAGIALADFTHASARGTIGDIPNLYLPSESVTIDLINNDAFGGTDKYMTGATKLALLTRDFELTLNWRSITPATSETVGGKPLTTVQGQYADWLDFRFTHSKMIGKFKLQASAGLGDIRNKGIKSVHRGIHHGIGMSVDGTDYTQQPEGLTKSADIYAGRLLGNTRSGFLIGTGLTTDKIMTSTYIQMNGRTSISDNFDGAFEASIHRQLTSDFYTDIRQLRYEVSLAALIGKYYQPGISFVTAFVNADQRGQLYAEPLRWNVSI